jgi:hypothetical protein
VPKPTYEEIAHCESQFIESLVIPQLAMQAVSIQAERSCVNGEDTCAQKVGAGDGKLFPWLFRGTVLSGRGEMSNGGRKRWRVVCGRRVYQN